MIVSFNFFKILQKLNRIKILAEAFGVAETNVALHERRLSSMILPWLEPNKEITSTLKINVPLPTFDHARLTPNDQPDSGFPTIKPHSESNSC